MNVQTRQVVNESGVLIVEIERFDVSHDDEYRRRNDPVLEEILIIKLPQTIDYRLNLSQRFAFEPHLRDLELIRNQANRFYKLQMLFFIQPVKVRKTPFVRLEERGSSSRC